MLAIQVNNQFLHLEADAAITVRIRFDVLSFENKEGSYTIPFSVPNNGFNRKVLGFPGRITNAAHTLEYADVRIWHSGKVMYIGNLVIEVSDGEIEGYIEIGNGSFWAQTQDVKLSELEISENFTPTGNAAAYAYFNAAADSTFPAYNFSVHPIYSPRFYESAAEIAAYIADDNYADYINPHPDSELDPDQLWLTIAQPYLCFVIKKIFAHYKIRIAEDWLSSSEFSKLTIFTLRSDIQMQVGTNFLYTFHFSSLPETSLQELITGLESLLAVKFVFNNEQNSVRIIDINNVLNNTSVIDVTNITEAEEGIKHVKEERFVLSQQADTTDEFAEEEAEEPFDVDTENYVSETAAGERENHKTPLSYLHDEALRTVIMSNDNSTIITKQMKCPRSDYPNGWELKHNRKMPLKLTFARGRLFDHRMAAGPGGTVDIADGSYPYATSGNRDENGDLIEGAEHTLQWAGEHGLYEKRWKNYFWWYKNIRKPIDREIWYSASQLKSLDPTAKIRINEVNYIAEGYEVTLFADKVSAAKCDLVVV